MFSGLALCSNRLSGSYLQTIKGVEQLDCEIVPKEYVVDFGVTLVHY